MCVYFTMHKNGKTKRHYNAVVGVLIYVSSNVIVNCLVRRLYPPSNKRLNSMLPSHINPVYPHALPPTPPLFKKYSIRWSRLRTGNLLEKFYRRAFRTYNIMYFFPLFVCRFLPYIFSNNNKNNIKTYNKLYKFRKTQRELFKQYENWMNWCEMEIKSY